MKRHPALREFSDDHHGGLVNARRLRRAASGEVVNSDDAGAAFLEFWREDTSIHFSKEEEVLLPILARHGVRPDEGPLASMLAQHSRIRGLAARLDGEVGRRGVRGETLKALGEQLEAHIRLEEREVFPMIEEVLPEEAMGEIARRLAAFDAGTLT